MSGANGKLRRRATEMRIAITAIVLGLVVGGCGLFDSGSNWSSGPFEVIWIDKHSDSHLAYRLDSTTSARIVDSCVSAAGANERYIAVRQHPPGATAGLAYYVVVKGKYSPSREPRDALIGPLSEAEFKSLGRRLALPALEPVLPEVACNAAA